MRQFTSLLIALMGFSLLGSAGQGQEDAAAKTLPGWLTPPKTERRLGPADQAARAALVKRIEASQTQEFRAAARVLVPEHSSGLPEKYRLSIYGKYSHPASADLLTIQVDDSKATAELVDSDGIWQGALPHRDLDQLVRQLAYAFQSQVQPRDEEGSGFFGGGTYATHMPSYIIEVESQGKQPLHLRTESWQLLHDHIGIHSEDVRGWMHTQVCDTLLKQARDQLPALPPETEKRQIVAALQAISAEKKTGAYGDELHPVTAYQREDRAAVEVVLYAHLAVQRAVPAALPELRRLRAVESIKKLEIVTVADPLPKLAAAIAGDDHDLQSWALELAEQDRPEYVQMLVDLLPKLPGAREEVISSVLGRLRDRKLNAAQLKVVAAVYQELPAGHTKAWTAAFLLNQTDDDKLYDDLMAQAKARPDDKSAPLYEASSYAIDAVLDYSARTKRRRDESYALLQALLKRMPAEAQPDSFEYFSLVEHWGGLGTRADLPRLEKLAENESGYLASSAVEAIAKIDPAVAVRKANERIAGYLARCGGDHDYNWNVSAYVDLWFWQNARAAAPALQRARELLFVEQKGQSRHEFDPQPLIDYLQATTPAARLAAAIAVAKARRIDPAWAQDVANDLIAAGIPAEQCRPLLEPESRRR